MSTSANADTDSAGLAEKKIMVIGFGQRLVATLIDGALVFISTYVIRVEDKFTADGQVEFVPSDPQRS